MITPDFALILQRAVSRAPSVRTWGLSPDLATAMEQTPAQMPAVYFVVSERGQPLDGIGTGLFLQNVSVSIDWVVMCRNYAGAEATLKEVGGVIAQLRVGLLGWTPPGCDMPMALGTRTDQRFASSVLTVQELHTTEYSIQITGDFE